ncbi:hypothetical protein D1164_20275 [Mariniphaga sediminis]|uniref:Uncharacterized protein n=1 Tax=Mariniphaga sediminis TaxID=1628158 RepID=A0A399CVS5_9BACT|nr:hypothetical protein D1164_20275 [Mariniphaga sediminis]
MVILSPGQPVTLRKYRGTWLFPRGDMGRNTGDFLSSLVPCPGSQREKPFPLVTFFGYFGDFPVCRREIPAYTGDGFKYLREMNKYSEDNAAPQYIKLAKGL